MKLGKLIDSAKYVAGLSTSLAFSYKHYYVVSLSHKIVEQSECTNRDKTDKQHIYYVS